MADIYTLILEVAKKKAGNYGTTSLVLLHLIRCSMVTPIVKMRAVRDALRDVRFCSIPLRFGMFFLHEFEIGSRMLKEVVDDPPEIQQLYRKTRNTFNHSNLKLVRGQHVTKMYPWGATPSWVMVKSLLENAPEDFVNPWEMTVCPHTNYLFNALFVHFTRNLWTALGESVISESQIPDPDTLDKAMASWTVKGVLELLGKETTKFLPSCNGLPGKFPKALQKSLSFKERARVFFPAPGTVISAKSIWRPFFEGRAYVGLYHSYLKDWSETQTADLEDFLDEIFDNLQCLPPLAKFGDRIWSGESGKVQFIVNPKFYKIQGIGSSSTPAMQKITVLRPQVSVKLLDARLQKHIYGTPLEKTLKRVKATGKSTKARNYRKPPTKKTQTKATAIATAHSHKIPSSHIASLALLSSSSSPSSKSFQSKLEDPTIMSEQGSSEW